MRWCRGAQGWDAGNGRQLLTAATNLQGAERTHRCGQTWRFQCEHRQRWPSQQWAPVHKQDGHPGLQAISAQCGNAGSGAEEPPQRATTRDLTPYSRRVQTSRNRRHKTRCVSYNLTHPNCDHFMLLHVKPNTPSAALV